MKNKNGCFVKGQEPHNKRNDIRERIDEVIKMHKEDLIPVMKIAKKFNCGRHLIQDLLRENNSLMNYSERRKLSCKKGTLKVWNDGLTIKDERVLKNYLANKKWRKENFNGKTYEEIYGKERAKEIKKKMGKIQSIIKKGEGNPMYGKFGKLNPNYGREVSLETRKKLRFNTLGKKIHSEKHKEMIRQKMKENNPMKLLKNRKKLSMSLQGTNSKDWKGFISFEPYTSAFNKKFKRAVRKRDNQICMNCLTHREKLKYTLHVHHINYDKLLSIPENCISLCRKCHGLTGVNRKHWTKFFQSLLNEKYNYKYSEDNLSIIDLEVSQCQ